tara:strand:+ start:309 stop:470 length:162 start_codon:yes stop_codon:yes gene_type:complete
MINTDLKIYGLNFTALFASSPMMTGINPMLQTIVLVLTIAYTGINIYFKLKNK